MIIKHFGFLYSKRGESMKKLKELFAPAAIENSSINDLWVQEVKFSKKANAAIVHLEIEEKIVPKDVIAFEKNAEKIFSLKSFKILPLVKSKLDVEEKELNDVLDYLKVLRPYTESVLNISKLEYIKESGIVNIELKVPNASFLKLQKTEECLSDIVSKYYGAQITFNITDATTAKDDFIASHKEEKFVAPVLSEKPKEQSSPTPQAKQFSSGQAPAFKPQLKQEAAPQTTKAENVIMGKDIS